MSPTPVDIGVALDILLSDLEGPLRIKLVDFGLAADVDAIEADENKFVGSEEYAAPELIVPSLNVSHADARAADMWAVGVIAFALLVGQLPFTQQRSEGRRRFFNRILHAQYKFP